MIAFPYKHIQNQPRLTRVTIYAVNKSVFVQGSLRSREMSEISCGKVSLDSVPILLLLDFFPTTLNLGGLKGTS